MLPRLCNNGQAARGAGTIRGAAVSQIGHTRPLSTSVDADNDAVPPKWIHQEQQNDKERQSRIDRQGEMCKIAHKLRHAAKCGMTNVPRGLRTHTHTHTHCWLVSHAHHLELRSIQCPIRSDANRCESMPSRSESPCSMATSTRCGQMIAVDPKSWDWLLMMMMMAQRINCLDQAASHSPSPSLSLSLSLFAATLQHCANCGQQIEII